MSERLTNAKNVLKTIAAIGGVGAASYLLFADGHVDALGDRPKFELSDTEKTEQFAQPWTTETRYKLQFLGGQVVSDKIDGVSGSGVLGIIRPAAYTIGDDCLASTAYDTRPSEIRGRASGDISAVAALSVEGEDIQVYPAGANTPPLSLKTDEQGVLQPNNRATRQTLDAYGCSMPVIGNAEVSSGS